MRLGACLTGDRAGCPDPGRRDRRLRADAVDALEEQEDGMKEATWQRLGTLRDHKVGAAAPQGSAGQP
jgi:hypothetical protein